MSYLSIPPAAEAKQYVDRNVERAVNTVINNFTAQIRETTTNSVSELVSPSITKKVVDILVNRGYEVHISYRTGPGLDYDKITIVW